jgi:hypothetical protein
MYPRLVPGPGQPLLIPELYNVAIRPTVAMISTGLVVTIEVVAHDHAATQIHPNILPLAPILPLQRTAL